MDIGKADVGGSVIGGMLKSGLMTMTEGDGVNFAINYSLLQWLLRIF